MDDIKINTTATTEIVTINSVLKLIKYSLEWLAPVCSNFYLQPRKCNQEFIHNTVCKCSTTSKFLHSFLQQSMFMQHRVLQRDPQLMRLTHFVRKKTNDCLRMQCDVFAFYFHSLIYKKNALQYDSWTVPQSDCVSTLTVLNTLFHLKAEMC